MFNYKPSHFKSRDLLVHFPGSQVLKRTYRMVGGNPIVKYAGTNWHLEEVVVGVSDSGEVYGYLKGVPA